MSVLHIEAISNAATLEEATDAYRASLYRLHSLRTIYSSVEFQALEQAVETTYADALEEHGACCAPSNDRTWFAVTALGLLVLGALGWAVSQ